MIDFASDSTVFIFGIIITVIFLIGYFFTIKELNEMTDHRNEKRHYKDTTSVKKE